jgi:hypothetical protein
LKANWTKSALKPNINLKSTHVIITVKMMLSGFEKTTGRALKVGSLLCKSTNTMNPSQNSLFKADAYVRAVAGVEFWDWFMGKPLTGRKGKSVPEGRQRHTKAEKA